MLDVTDIVKLRVVTGQINNSLIIRHKRARNKESRMPKNSKLNFKVTSRTPYF